MKITRYISRAALALALIVPAMAQAQILPSGAQQVQGTEGLNRGWPVAVVLTDGNGNLSAGSGGGPVTGNVADATTDSGNPVKTGGIFLTTPPTYLTGQRTTFQTDNRGNQKTTICSTNSCAIVDPGSSSNGLVVTTWPTTSAGVAAAQAVTAAVASSLTAKATTGNLYNFNVTTGATAGYILVFPGNAPPADGAVTPAMCYAVAANTTLDKSFNFPIGLTGGITIVFSSTGCFTKTASATAFIQAGYK